MSRIKGSNTEPEMLLRKYLFSKGYRYRVNVRVLPGSPDIVFRKYNTVIFVHGCFWHMHEGCKYFRFPSANAEWWREKLMKNKERDERNIRELRKLGWRVLVIWECEIKDKSIFHEDRISKMLEDK